MKITIWGSRGSAPVSASDSGVFGGNTTCLEVSSSRGDRIIIDAGTGIRNLGEAIGAKDSGDLAILLTHTHWDHIQGMPFFKPLYKPGWKVAISGPAFSMPINHSLEHMFNGIHFPLHLDEIPGQINFYDLQGHEMFTYGDFAVATCPVRHPGGGLAYRISADGWSFVFTGDHEHMMPNESDEACAVLEDFMKGAQVLVADSQFTAREYMAYQGWGHTSIDVWPALASRLGIKRLVLTHHDPLRTDNNLRDIRDDLRRRFVFPGLDIEMAFDGMVIEGADKRISRSPAHSSHYYNLGWVHEVNKRIARYGDVDMIIDTILEESRKASRAEAGTLYLVDGQDLVFAYTHNDKLFPGTAGIKQLYHNLRIPISPASIAGYAAISRKTLVLDDVRNLPPGMPFSFNDSWDRQSGYRTVSIMVIPLLREERLLGVLQLINSLDSDGAYIPFSVEMQNQVEYLNDVAVNALERGIMARELILRMLRMTKLRDPMETGGHVHRVGAMAAELYHYWAEAAGHAEDDIKLVKDRMRTAAMLHDIGKIGISDIILKKPGALNAEERAVMEQHCFLGAQVLSNVTSEVDSLARSVVLHHHQKWNGQGYSGHATLHPLAGEDIPLEARITALADVYDALRSKRCYKEPMPFDKALAIIKKDMGSHFDPGLAEIFISNIEVMESIIDFYPNEDDEGM